MVLMVDRVVPYLLSYTKSQSANMEKLLKMLEKQETQKSQLMIANEKWSRNENVY